MRFQHIIYDIYILRLNNMGRRSMKSAHGQGALPSNQFCLKPQQRRTRVSPGSRRHNAILADGGRIMLLGDPAALVRTDATAESDVRSGPWIGVYSVVSNRGLEEFRKTRMKSQVRCVMFAVRAAFLVPARRSVCFRCVLRCLHAEPIWDLKRSHRRSAK